MRKEGKLGQDEDAEEGQAYPGDMMVEVHANSASCSPQECASDEHAPGSPSGVLLLRRPTTSVWAIMSGLFQVTGGSTM